MNAGEEGLKVSLLAFREGSCGHTLKVGKVVVGGGLFPSRPQDPYPVRLSEPHGRLSRIGSCYGNEALRILRKAKA